LIGRKFRSVGLRVERAENDTGRSLCYIDQKVVEELQLLTGSIIEIKGNKRTTGIVIPSSITDKGKNLIRLDNLQLLNAGAKVGDFIRINKAAVFPAEEIELTPTSAESGLLKQKEAIKAKIIDKPIVKGDIIDILGASYQESDPEDPVNHIMKLFSKPQRKRNFIESMRMVVEKTQPFNKIVKITRDTKVTVNNCIAILNNRGEIVSYEYPSYNKKDDNQYRRVIEDLLSYTENLEDRVKNSETEKKLINLERKKLEYGKRILKDAIGRLTNITTKLLESLNARGGNLENMRKEREISEFSDLENLVKNLTTLERLISDNSSDEDSQYPEYCRYCGGDVEDNQIYCRHCGTRVN